MPSQSQTLTYDLDGNLTSDGRWDYFWDAENRLIEVKATSAAFSAGFPLDRMTYTYDVSGRMIQRRRQQWSTAEQTWLLLEESRHLYDGWQCIADLNGSLVIHYSYAWGTDLSGSRTGAGGVGGLLWVREHLSVDKKRFFAAYDGNGNVTALYNDTGAIVARYEYGPFGEALRVTATHSVGGANPWRWSTKRTDPTTDLVHYEYRVYDPGAGRWISRDPINELGAFLVRSGKSLFIAGLRNSPPVGNAVDIDINKFLVGMGGNVFVVNGNDVLNFVDYLGLAPFCVCIRAASDHAWIMVTDLATGEVHSYGRYKITYGNPPADHTGVNKDIDLRRSHSVERCVKVDSFTPTVNTGYGLYNNNCATYAWGEWKRVSGEDLDKSSLGSFTYDHPDVLKDSIEKMNKKKPRNECDCAKPPAKKK